MPAEVCLECMRALTTDGVAWSCNPCRRSGCYDRFTLPNGRVIVVRMVTRWSDAA